MSDEHKNKKIKLSSINEPLKQRDVIYFQKEALFRLLNNYKNNYNLEKINNNNLNYNLDILNKIILLFINVFKLWSNSIDNNDIIIDYFNNLDLTDLKNFDFDKFNNIIDSFINIFIKNDTNNNLILKNFNNNFIIDDILLKNTNLNNKIIEIKSFYNNLIKNYERDNSISIKRVFKISPEEEEEKEKEKNNNNNIKEEEEEEKIEKEKEKEEEIKIEQSNDKINEFNNKKDIILHDLKINELNNKITELNFIIDDLNNKKINNENEIINLNVKINNLINDNNTNDNNDLSFLNKKIIILTNENEKLKIINNQNLIKFQKLNKENEIFTNKLKFEFENAQNTLLKHNSSLEKDLVRIRSTRDDLLSKIDILKSEKDKNDIIIDSINLINILQEQFKKFENRDIITTDNNVLKIEIKDLEKSFKNLTELTNKKYLDNLNNESILTKLNIEKTKADQKYFNAMRSKDSILIENKNLTKSLNKSNDLIQQLKDSDRLLQQKILNLNNQLEISQNNEKKLISNSKLTNIKLLDLEHDLSILNKKILNFKNENSNLINENKKFKFDIDNKITEIKKINLNFNNLNDNFNILKKKLISLSPNTNNNNLLSSNSTITSNDDILQDLNNFRSLVYCSLCSKNWKNMTIKTCGHVFCENCCKDRVASRMRKCPTCNKPFSANDLLSIHL